METIVTNGVRITVQSHYEPQYSHPDKNQFVFSYRIDIENKNEFPIQLLSRKWIIVDAGAETKVIEGDGVLGEQPIIEPGAVHSYESGCPISSEFGIMRGKYILKNTLTEQEFKVTIPEFKLVVDYILN